MMEIQLINYDSVNLIEEIIGVIELGNVTIATQGGGGTADHAQLTNRDIADQHPISSITDLQTTLNDKADSDSVYDISTMNTLLSTKSDTSHNHSLANLTEKSYNSLDDIPIEFTPSAHTQAISTITNLETELNSKIEEVSCGALTNAVCNDNGNGTINVPSLDVTLYNGIRVEKYTLTTTNNIALTDNVMNYIVADYNNGNPIIKNITDVNLINELTIIPLCSIYRNGTVLHTQQWDALGFNLPNKLHRSIVKTQRFRRESGLALSVFGTRNVALTQGTIYVGAVENILSAIDSTIDNIIYYTHVGGVWTRTADTQLNNTQYDNGTDLVTLTANRYAINWLYRGVESQKHLYCVLGTGDYTLTQAQTAQPPSIPTAISSHAVLVGRVIFQLNSNTPTQIDSAFDVTFNQSSTTIHNDLSGLNDGDFKHLTATEKTAFDAISTTYEPKFSILTIDKGGTNANTANGALNQLLPSQSANSGKVLGTNGTNASWVTMSGGGSLTIENNGVDLTSRSKLNFVGKQLIADNATNTSTDIQMFPNMPADSYINQNVYPSLEWVWKHTDGYWYYVTNVLSRTSGYVGANSYKFIIYKTIDWITNIEVCSYENNGFGRNNPKLAMDSNGNILMITTATTPSLALNAVFFDSSNNYNATNFNNIATVGNSAVETTVSLNVSADNRFGVAFFQKHTGSTSYSQLMYVERSAGSGGTWGTPEILGATPLRAATVTSAGAIQLFYTSTNEPIIAFLNNASATSSKVAIAKKVSGTWTVYDSAYTSLLSSAIDSSDNVYLGSAPITKFTYSSNSFGSHSITSGIRYLTINSNNDIYAITSNSIAATAFENLYYRKNSENTFHRAIRPYMQIGAVISANAYSTFGIYTVIPYSRQRLADAYHLVIRTDGAIFMEVI